MINVSILEVYASRIFSCIIAIVANVFLMIGAAKKKRSFLLPWLVLEVNILCVGSAFIW